MTPNETTNDPLKVTLGQVQIVFISVQIVIGLTTVIGAVVVIGLYGHEGKGSKSSHKHIISLATADLLQGMISSPIQIFLSFGVKINEKMCFEILTLGITSIFTTMFVLISMSIDRYMAILHPLYYKTHMTNLVANCKISEFFYGKFYGAINFFF